MKANILIIDDDRNKLDSLELILRTLDQNIIKCISGKDGLRAILANEIAVILLDVNMPGMDGFETAKLIRARTKTSVIPIIFITAFHTGELDVSKGYELGAVDYIFYPFNESFLLAKIKVFLDLYFLRNAELDNIQKLKESKEELIKLNEKLVRSNKDLEQFAYVASHDLQEPLIMIAAYTQLLEQKYKNKLDQDANEYIQFVVDGANRLQLLIHNLLEYSKISLLDNMPEEADTTILLGRAVANLQQQINDNGAIITTMGLPFLKCNPFQIVRLFQNLISNAIKFRKDSENPKIHITCEEKNDIFLFSVKDNGIGIASEYFNRIFVTFKRLHTQEKYPGTGIELAICKQIVERHNGKIWVESKPNQGTTFYFTLNKIKTSQSEKTIIINKQVLRDRK